MIMCIEQTNKTRSLSLLLKKDDVLPTSLRSTSLLFHLHTSLPRTLPSTAVSRRRQVSHGSTAPCPHPRTADTAPPPEAAFPPSPSIVVPPRPTDPDRGAAAAAATLLPPRSNGMQVRCRWRSAAGSDDLRRGGPLLEVSVFYL